MFKNLPHVYIRQPLLVGGHSQIQSSSIQISLIRTTVLLTLLPSFSGFTADSDTNMSSIPTSSLGLSISRLWFVESMNFKLKCFVENHT